MKPLFASRHGRGLAYATLGVTGEVLFTALSASTNEKTRSAKLQGHSYAWMLPIYGSAAWLFEPLHDRLRPRPAWQHAAVYACGIIGVEFAAGSVLTRTIGLIPWDYSEHSRLAIRGAIRLDYLPLWALVGLAAERIHDRLIEG